MNGLCKLLCPHFCSARRAQPVECSTDHSSIEKSFNNAVTGYCKSDFLLGVATRPFLSTVWGDVPRRLYNDQEMPPVYLFTLNVHFCIRSFLRGTHLSGDECVNSHSKRWSVPSFERINVPKKQSDRPTIRVTGPWSILGDVC